MCSVDGCGFSLEKHSCVPGSRPVEFHYHYLATRTACGLRAVRDFASCRVPTGCYGLGSNRISYVSLLLKVSEHAGKYSSSGMGAVAVLVVHARARMG